MSLRLPGWFRLLALVLPVVMLPLLLGTPGPEPAPAVPQAARAASERPTPEAGTTGAEATGASAPDRDAGVPQAPADARSTGSASRPRPHRRPSRSRPTDPAHGLRSAAPATRGALAAALARRSAPGGRIPPCTGPPFPDVPAGHPFCPEIRWLSSRGMVTAHPDGTFRPDALLTREDLATFLVRGAP